MGTLERTWSLYKQSFNILSADAEIVLFPVMSAVSAVLVAVGFFYPLFRSGIFEGMNPENLPWEYYALFFIWYFLNFLVIIFFNSALVGCANMRLAGGDPRVRDGLRIALRRMDKIVAWAFVAATVGVVLDMIRNRSNRLVGKLLAGGMGLAWTLATYLVVPVLILEDRTTVDSIRRSGELFRKRWGEQIAGNMGFGLLNFLMLLPALFLGLFLFKIDPALAVIFGIWYVLILAAVTSAVKGVFTVVLFRYASTGELPSGFSARTIDAAFGERKRDPWDINV